MRMIVGFGMELVEIDLFDAPRHAAFFLPSESEYCRARSRPSQHFAARLAAKKAFLAALGAPEDPSLYLEIEVRNDPSGRPSLALAGEARRLAGAAGVKAIHLSLTHSDRYAGACVLLER
jgi:holo-[acyl-carrier protein] synthase